MKCKVGSPINRFIPKTMFYLFSDLPFLRGRCPCLGKTVWREGRALDECLLLRLFLVAPLLPCVPLHFMTAYVALGQELPFHILPLHFIGGRSQMRHGRAEH